MNDTAQTSKAVLFIYSEIMSSEDNFYYWKAKLEKQLEENSLFGLVSFVPSVPQFHKASKTIANDYKKWVKGIRPAFQERCCGYAIVAEDSNSQRKFSKSYLKKVEEAIGCECRLFSAFEEAIIWLEKKQGKGFEMDEQY